MILEATGINFGSIYTHTSHSVLLVMFLEQSLEINTVRFFRIVLEAFANHIVLNRSNRTINTFTKSQFVSE